MAICADLGDCVDGVNAIRVVLGKARSISLYVAVENDVLSSGRKSILDHIRL